MLARLSSTLRQYARGWQILVFLALGIFFSAVIFPGKRAAMEAISGGAGPLDLQFFYTPDKAYSMVAAYGDAGRALYRTFELTGDVIYPVVYTLLFSLLMTWLFRRGFAPQSKVQGLNVAPFGAGLFDLLENLGIVTMLSVHPATPAFVAWLTTIFTMLKWSFAAVSILLVLLGTAMALKNRFKRQG